MKKLCIKCQEIKPVSEFGKDKRRPDGLFPYCKRCRLKDPQKSDEKKKNRAKGLNYCNRCKNWLEPSNFYANPSTPNGLHRQCKSCSIEQSGFYYHSDKDRAYQKNKSRYWNNKEVEQGRYKAWYKTPKGKILIRLNIQRRKARIKSLSNTLTEREWIEILKCQNYTCLACGKKFSKSLRPTMDHVIPVAKGGELTKENTQALCRSCNSKKGTKIIDYRQHPFF